MKYIEANFDGLVGPTHNYAGLSLGNVASLNNACAPSNPRAAVKQGLAKMKALHDMGMTQGILAPQERPDVHTLRRLGFSGSDTEVIVKAAQQAPELLIACCSASSMWTANATTVSPSADTQDGRVHFTPANLANKFHRSLEPETTGRILKRIFQSDQYFAHHRHLPENDAFGDEGAANHTRLCSDYGTSGLELFVFGKSAFDRNRPAPVKFPARQTLEASQAIARLHGLNENNTLFIQQNPETIDKGVFHNDVIAVGNGNVFLYHQQAFANSDSVINQIKTKFGDHPLHLIEVKTDEVSLQEAISTYLFNTQIINLPNGEMAIIAPSECLEQTRVHNYLNELITRDTPIKQVCYFDVKQSMQNGGGPACLRLRVALSEQELAATNQSCLMSEELFNKLNSWADKHYRDRLTLQDLADPQLLNETREALSELTDLLNLGSVYQFQR